MYYLDHFRTEPPGYTEFMWTEGGWFPGYHASDWFPGSVPPPLAPPPRSALKGRDVFNLNGKEPTAKGDLDQPIKVGNFSGAYKFENRLYFNDNGFGTGPFKEHLVFSLDGTLTAKGGDVKCVNLNGTYPDTILSFSAQHPAAKDAAFFSRDVSGTFGGKVIKGTMFYYAHFFIEPPGYTEFIWDDRADGESDWFPGNAPYTPPSPPPGLCTIYKTVKSEIKANSSTFSAFFKKQNAALHPSWPASSPWVTSVGATRFINNDVGQAEMASDAFGSGGGFSEMYDQTDATWQVGATAKYLSTVDASTLPPVGSFPTHGRGTPDVSALGEGYQVIVDGIAQPVGGTSASSPAFAGIISLLNEARIVAGKPVMGFLNPFLYKNAEAFTDVVQGSNKVGRDGETLKYGYQCSAGWDPATGLGTPVFSKLLTAAMASN